MFKSLSFKHLAVVFVFLVSLLIGSASAGEPFCTVTYDKDSYMLGETVKAYYEIDFDGECEILFVEWCIIADWETEDIQPSDSFHEMTTLEGDISFKPTYGEGAIPYFTLVEPDGEWHAFWGQSVRISGKTTAEPKCTVTFDKDTYTFGETINAHYKLDFDGEYEALYAEWNIIADWDTGDIQAGDSFHQLTAPEGDLFFTPADGEGAILYFTLVESSGKWHSLISDPVQVILTDASEPKCTVTFDKMTYELGETINAHYKIDFDEKYTELYAEWGIITDWEKSDIQFNDNSHKLTTLEGDLSFTPNHGEGVVLYLTLAESNGKWHSFYEEPIRINSSGVTFLPKTLMRIEEEAFKGSKFTRIVCPESLSSIGSRAFSDCTNLKSITIPASVKSIADDAFDGCASLTTIITAKGSAAEEYALRHGYKINYL